MTNIVVPVPDISMALVLAALVGAMIALALFIGYQEWRKRDTVRDLKAAIRAVDRAAGIEPEEDPVEVAKRNAEEAALRDQLRVKAAKL